MQVARFIKNSQALETPGDYLLGVSTPSTAVQTPAIPMVAHTCLSQGTSKGLSSVT